ncbi:hypothetical protein Lesp02_20960 [Lentzea sp. NBRC 105346]|uniref:hypothetical protein n=1 Tax=Lentzea sp. NBRC 105346 TaxID=3032205 RepID=UPI0024A1F870|nr:hypothetical protein [Lentzea sp. NBRC 105346]GLZ29906.1 hypothetical protein Lesp02_20960 [Lentzea sp. NBRC 105346]
MPDGRHVSESIRNEAIEHCELVWPLLVQGRIDDSKIDQANDYLGALASHSRLMHDIVILMIERATGVSWDAIR